MYVFVRVRVVCLRACVWASILDPTFTAAVVQVDAPTGVPPKQVNTRYF